ncbi:MAG: hypothetical protein HY678_11720 [Chloroflexi bacterium]|nr:hypothetical protein [Chloroflexota bacterium]
MCKKFVAGAAASVMVWTSVGVEHRHWHDEPSNHPVRSAVATVGSYTTSSGMVTFSSGTIPFGSS